MARAHWHNCDSMKPGKMISKTKFWKGNTVPISLINRSGLNVRFLKRFYQRQLENSEKNDNSQLLLLMLSSVKTVSPVIKAESGNITIGGCGRGPPLGIVLNISAFIKVIGFALQSIFMTKSNKLKKAIATGLVGLALAMPMKARAESFLDKIDVGVSAGVEYNFKNPIDYTQLNKDFREGKYTFLTPIPQWEDIQAGNSFVMPEINGTIDFKIADGVRIGVKGGYKSGKSEIKYDKNYDIYDSLGKIPTKFTRNETFDISTPTIGLSAKIDLSKDTKINLGGILDFCSIKGNVDYTMNDNPNTPITGPPWEYTQWRKANYSGSGIIPSVEAGLEQKIIDGISVSVAGGMKFGKVEASGEHLFKDNTGTLDWKKSAIEYNPCFDFNNSYGKIEVKYTF